MLLCSAVAFGTAGTACALAVTDGLPSLEPLLILGLLYVYAEHSDVVLPNNSSLSASFMVAMASIVVFDDHSALLGPLLVGACGGIYLPHIRRREWSKVVFNSSNFALASLVGSAVYQLVPETVTDSVVGQLGVALPTGLAWSLMDFLLLTAVLTIAQRRLFADVGRELWLGDLQIYPFALMGVLLGRLYLELGGWILPLFVAPIFIARQAFASYMNLRAAHEATLSTLVRALESKDGYTAGHVERVAKFAGYVGEALKLRHSQLERLRYAALMHDIGKLVVPNHILNKPGRLTEEEFRRMRRHEDVSVELLRRIDFLAAVAPSVADHSLNAGPPLEARVIAVADAFDAMTSTRAYRKALTQEVAFAELLDKAGVQFDGRCVDALIAEIERRGERYGDGHEVDVHDFAVPPPTVGTGSAGLGDLEPDRGRAGR